MLACRYTKWLVGRDGRVYGPYMPRSRPSQQEASIVRLLEEGEVEEARGAAKSAGGGVAVAPAEHDSTIGTFVFAGKSSNDAGVSDGFKCVHQVL